MPRGNGNGPMGAGPMTGRGFGSCTEAIAVNHDAGPGQGLGFACRHGFGRGFGRGIAITRHASETQKEMLQAQKNSLKDRLDAIDKQLENL